MDMVTAKGRKRKLKVTIEDVQLCIANAERLLADADKVSEPSAVALSELALEETLKGWVLYVHRTDEKRDARRTALVAAAPIRRYLDDNAALLKRIESRTVFKSHWAKLDALRFVAGFIRISLKHTPVKELVESARKVTPGGTSMSGFIDEPVIAQVGRLLTVVNEEEARELTGLKEKGFYVNLSDRDQLVSPDSLLFPNGKVFAVYVRMILSVLKGTVTTTTA